MKFLYEYRTSDNVKHQGVIDAPTREEAFQTLRAQGVKPGSMQEAPGFFNKWLGKGKRWTVIALLALLSLGLLAVLLSSSLQDALSPSLRAKRSNPFSYVTPEGYAVGIERRQIWGDAAVIEQARATQWKGLFSLPAEQFLAMFAQPGVTEEVFPEFPELSEDDFIAALNHRISIAPFDLDEYQQMKCIVEGIKKELQKYLIDGGTIDGFLKRLVQRQREEADFVEKAKKELNTRIQKGEDPLAAWQDMNRILREQGLRSIPLPTE